MIKCIWIGVASSLNKMVEKHDEYQVLQYRKGVIKDVTYDRY